VVYIMSYNRIAVKDELSVMCKEVMLVYFKVGPIP
jgi:hypothetical protein